MGDAGADASFLTILLETSPFFFSQLTALTDLTPASYVEQVLAFVNVYLMLNDANKLAVFSVGTTGCHLLYKTDNCTAGREGSRASNFSYDGRGTHELLLHLEQALRLDAEADHTAASRPLGETALSSTLSRALCFIHRMQRGSSSSRSQRLLPEDATPSTAPGGGDHASRSRLLCLLASPDVTSQYIPIMNAIFCAQRSDVIIDGCKLGPKHSAFLQQAAYLTGGIYLRPSRPQALAQYLLFLRLPRPTSVDLRASCFCHKRPIDQGFVCSVCLSIFCTKDMAVCSTCGTEFTSASGKT